MNRFEFVDYYKQKVTENNDNLTEVIKEFISDFCYIKMLKQKEGWLKDERGVFSEFLEKKNDVNFSKDLIKNPAVFVLSSMHYPDFCYLDEIKEEIYEHLSSKNPDKMMAKSKDDFKDVFAYIFYEMKSCHLQFLTNEDLIKYYGVEKLKNKIFQNKNFNEKDGFDILVVDENVLKEKYYYKNENDCFQYIQSLDSFLLSQLEEGFKNQTIEDKLRKIKNILTSGTPLKLQDYEDKFIQKLNQENPSLTIMGKEYQPSVVMKKLDLENYVKGLANFIKQEVDNVILNKKSSEEKIEKLIDKKTNESKGVKFYQLI